MNIAPMPNLDLVKDTINIVFWLVASFGGAITAFVALRQRERDLAQAQYRAEQELKVEIYKDLGNSIAAARAALVKAAVHANAIPEVLRFKQKLGQPVRLDSKDWSSKRARQASDRLEELSVAIEKYKIVFSNEVREIGRNLNTASLRIIEKQAEISLAAGAYVEAPDATRPPNDLQRLNELVLEFDALCQLIDERVQTLQVNAQTNLLGSLFPKSL